VNNEQVKRILLAYRPGSQDQKDPEVAEALAAARHDPELEGWLEQQEAFHKVIGTGLRNIAIPADLKERILNQRKIIVPLWRRPEFLLAAACLALAMIVSAFWLGRSSEDETFRGFRSRMVGFALREYRMDIVTNDLVQIRENLRKLGGPVDYALTPGLQKTPAIGGTRLSWQDNPVSMVCFALPKNQTLYMFVMDRAAIARGGVPGATPEWAAFSEITTASWSQDGKLYLLAAADPVVLKNDLPPEPIQ
jgi:hypothetical protein